MDILITPELKATWQHLFEQLTGAARRLFMASVIKAAGRAPAHNVPVPPD